MCIRDRIIIGLVLVLVPNIIAQWDSISASISRMSSGEMTVLSSQSGAFGPALWSAVLYFFFQLASVSVMYQHMESVTDVKQINRAAIGMFLCNFLAMELSIVGPVSYTHLDVYKRQLSSRIDKYKRIMEKKEKAGKSCDILHIVKLDDSRESAFLIQDMFPITEKYIERAYTIAGNPLMLTSEHTAREIERKARKVMGMLKRGIKFTPTQPDVMTILKKLRERG